MAFNYYFETGDFLQEKRRIHTLDEIRGFCVFCMIFDHCLFTLGYMFGHEFSQNLFEFFEHISPAFAATFVMLCGISCTFSRNNFLRGLKIAGAAIVVTVVSLFLMEDSPIIFGVLHLLATCVILYIPLKKVIEKIPTIAGIAVCAALFFLTYEIDSGHIGIGSFGIELPRSFYSGELMILGFRNPTKGYSDYFPLLPWMFAFFSGAFLGKYVTEGKVPEGMYKSRVPFLSMIGTHAFFVYLVHQPLAYGVYYLLTLAKG